MVTSKCAVEVICPGGVAVVANGFSGVLVGVEIELSDLY